MKKKSMNIVLALTVITMLALNMAHPVTPMFIRELGMPSYMFGVLFAAMSIGNLIFSPIWGKLSDKNGRVKFMMLGILGYGISQLGFGFSTNTSIIIIFRFLGGAFITSYLTVIIAYISDITDEGNRLKGMTYFAAATTVGSSLGSLLGGVIGNNNYKITFFTQFSLCIIIVILQYILLDETVNKKVADKCKERSRDFIGGEKLKINGLIIFVMVQVMFFYFASTSYNSSVNYFIESVLNLPPKVNGIFLSIAGICGFIANMTLTPILGKKFGEEKTFKYITLAVAVSIGLVGISSSHVAFFIFAILFVSCASIYVPIQQNIVTKLSNSNHGQIVGIQNSAKAVGMIIGSLYSGFIFDFGSKLPFITASAILMIGYINIVLRGIGDKNNLNIR